MPVTDDDDEYGTVTMAATQSTTSKAEQRKSNKPIMEKKRRARINHCLNELKSLILNAMKKDPARHSKLEKADILEMTVKHLQTVQRQQLATAVATDPTVITKFRSGFDECATEVSRYISRLDGVDHGVKQRLSAHLHRCVSSLQQMAPSNQPGQHDDNNNSSSNHRTLLIPSRLPSGELALVIPKGYSSSNYLPSAPNSAFTVIKNESHSPRFQPFQVDIPNSQLTAHISIPDAFEKRNGVPSPKRELLSPAQHRESDRRIISNHTDNHSERLHLPSLCEESEHQEIESERRVQMNFSMVQKFNMRQTDNSARLHAALVNQKPNPNYHLNPKAHSALKYVRHGEHKLNERTATEHMGPSPPKFARYQCVVSPPTSETRSSVIVSDQGKDVLLASTSKANQPEKQVTNRDMWRPW